MSLAQPGSHVFCCDIVDDDPNAVDLVGRIVTRHGWTVRRFRRVEDQLAALTVRHPDLIVMDIWLEGADALEAIPRYRAAGYEGHIQVMSARDPQRLLDIYVMCERYGYRALYPIAKPARSSAMASALDHLRSLDADRGRSGLPAEREPKMGWMIPLGPREAPSILAVPPGPVASDQDDISALREFVDAVDATRAHVAERLEWGGTVPVWVMSTILTGLRIPMAGQSALANMARSGGVTIMVALGEANRAPEALLDLKVRTSLHHIGLSLFADDLGEFSLATLACGAVAQVLLGERLIERIWTNTAARLMAEHVFVACRDRGVSLAAACDPESDPGRMLRALGVTCFATSYSEMHLVSDFPNAPLPRWAGVSARHDQSLPPLPDFPGRHMLTKREQQVVHLTAYGQSAKEAGRTLGVSYRTVEVHRTNIFSKLGVRNVAQLTHLALGGR